MMEYDHLDPAGSLMDRIQALIQPPQSEESAKKSKKTEKEARKPGRAVNHDNCDSCGEGGDLLCCDRCPCAFHLSCCDPPLDEDDIPDGEWLCNECKSSPKEVDEEVEEKNGQEEKEAEIKETVNCKPESPFSTLVKMSAGKNPRTFSLPPELKCNTLFPGDRKRGSNSDEKLPPAKNGRRNCDSDEHGLTSRRLCFACSRTELSGHLVHCDFCPLVFHNDCLNPPLTTPPTGMWMCPNHAEHAEPGLRDPRFSKRCRAYHDLRNNISQHTIKLNFLKRVHRLQNHPGFKRKAHLPTKRRATLVPQAIKDHYECPPVTQLPEHVRRMQDPLPLHLLPQHPPSAEDQEEWLRCVVNLQCSIARQLSQLPANKTLISNYAPNMLEGSTVAKSEPVCTTTPSASSAVSNASTTASSGAARDIVANGIVTSKSESTNGVGSTCINRVVTTTITTTSGGKTVTKPLTILYASPSKIQSHMNGPLPSNCGKTGVSAGTASAVSSLSNSLPTKMSVKQEPKLEKTGLSPGQQKVNGIPKLLSDSPHLNNVKVKNSSDGAKTVSGASGSSPNSMGSGGTRIVAAVTATSTVSTSTASANKVTPTTPTKLLVLTSASSGNIIKTIASAGATQLSGGTLLTLSAPGGVNSGTAKVLSGVTNSPAVTTSVGSSPSRVVQAASTSAVTASAINSICAAAGVDAFNELAKLDPRLIQVLAYQRLQQLLTQTKPVPPSPVAARKITFNGLKEALVLPQQSVNAGCSIAVLCPLTGTGPVSSMVHKCLTIGKGPDMDVSLHHYGHCNFVSEKHCCIFHDEMSKQYELINYSEHGTYVDNVLYSCDFSDKINRHITSAKGLDPSKVSKSKLLSAAENKNRVKSKVARRTVGLGVQNISQPCGCTTSSSNLIGGSGAGWEGTALLHHGSYIKVGCIQFVFSITNQASKFPPCPKVAPVSNSSASKSATLS